MDALRIVLVGLFVWIQIIGSLCPCSAYELRPKRKPRAGNAEPYSIPLSNRFAPLTQLDEEEDTGGDSFEGDVDEASVAGTVAKGEEASVSGVSGGELGDASRPGANEPLSPGLGGDDVPTDVIRSIASNFPPADVFSYMALRETANSFRAALPRLRNGRAVRLGYILNGELKIVKKHFQTPLAALYVETPFGDGDYGLHLQSSFYKYETKLNRDYAHVTYAE